MGLVIQLLIALLVVWLLLQIVALFGLPQPIAAVVVILFVLLLWGGGTYFGVGHGWGWGGHR
jgi:hypothetical protein